MAYPLMLYRDGWRADDHVTVNDEAEEAAAEGYQRLDMAALKNGGPLVPAGAPVAAPEPAEPVKRGPGRPRKVQP